MIMKWSDLEIGDKVMVSKEYDNVSRSWNYNSRSGILEITKVESFYYGDERLRIWIKPVSTNGQPKWFEIYFDTGVHCGTHSAVPLFEIVELKD